LWKLKGQHFNLVEPKPHSEHKTLLHKAQTASAFNSADFVLRACVHVPVSLSHTKKEKLPDSL
jgi:hypothetical protein